MHHVRRVGFLAGLLLPALSTAGCGRGLPSAMDVGEARVALSAALDAWKDGQSPESLRDRKPPVDFRDVSWDRGNKLRKYEIEREEPAGVSARMTVKLHLSEKSGANRTRVAVYTVDAGPVIVIRPDSLQPE